MKKGDFVKCLISHDIAVTTGNSYEIVAVEGDIDFVCGGEVLPGGFIVHSDYGYGIYCINTGSCAFGEWELVE